MGQKYIWREDGTVDRIDENYIWHEDGTVDRITEKYIYRDDGSIDRIDGNYIYRSDGAIDRIDGNRMWRISGSVDQDMEESCKNNSNYGGGTQQQWVRTPSRKVDPVEERKANIRWTVGGIIAFILIIGIFASIVITTYTNKQKNSYYSIYQTTRNCEVREYKKFTLGAYYVHNVSKGTYIFSIKTESGKEHYYFQKGSDLVSVKIDDDVISTFKYRGEITEYDYEHTNWKEKFE